MNTYTIIVHRKGKAPLVKKGVDKLNSIIIPADIKMEYEELFKNGTMSIEIIKEA